MENYEDNSHIFCIGHSYLERLLCYGSALGKEFEDILQVQQEVEVRCLAKSGKSVSDIRPG